MSDQLAEYLEAIAQDERYNVDAVLKEGTAETTQRVSLVDEDGTEHGPYVRKYIDKDTGIGAVYERIMQTQGEGRTLEHLPRIIDCYEVAGRRVVIMEYVEGETLADVVYRRDPSLELAREIFPRICDAVSELHEKFDPPIIHRDLKPSNIMVAGERLVIIDFGIARTFKEDSDTDTHHFGTRAYAPPEQFGFGQTDVRSDVYALGMLLYFCLTEQTPDQKARDSGFQVRGVPEAVSAVIVHATALDPTQRYESAAQLKAAFLSACAEDADADADLAAATGADVAAAASADVGADADVGVAAGATANTAVIADAAAVAPAGNDAAGAAPAGDDAAGAAPAGGGAAADASAGYDAGTATAPAAGDSAVADAPAGNGAAADFDVGFDANAAAVSEQDPHADTVAETESVADATVGAAADASAGTGPSSRSADAASDPGSSPRSANAAAGPGTSSRSADAASGPGSSPRSSDASANPSRAYRVPPSEHVVSQASKPRRPRPHRDPSTLVGRALAHIPFPIGVIWDVLLVLTILAFLFTCLTFIFTPDTIRYPELAEMGFGLRVARYGCTFLILAACAYAVCDRRLFMYLIPKLVNVSVWQELLVCLVAIIVGAIGIYFS